MSKQSNIGLYYSLSQIGLEMVIPAALGAVLDYYLQWGFWGVTIGLVLGFVGGLYHITTFLNNQQKAKLDAEKDHNNLQQNGSISLKSEQVEQQESRESKG
ncbi:MAG: AtpZ/AtpI family protein [Gemmataceae bacterium]